MKLLFSTLFLLFFSSITYAQEPPVLNVGDKALDIISLDIKVDIIGNIATTTYDMVFYNPSNNELEGLLVFPLGEGHHVSRFALDIRGKLREAVVVDKELGRIAFESVVRRRVDPALLEKGTGNNYTARIYPIPANGYKRLLLAYEQELTLNNNNHYYQLPLHFNKPIAKFTLGISVFDQLDTPVIIEGEITGDSFKNWEQYYKLNLVKTNFTANKNILIKIPLTDDIQKLQTYKTYFYLYKKLKKQIRLRNKPKNITLLWDASLSLKNRNIEKEMALLAAYFDYLKDVNVCFVSFSNTIQSEQFFTIKNGDWKAIKQWIQQTVYDGGTSFKSIETKLNKSDICLLFSDGISNLSATELNSKKPIFVINSSIVANHAGLKRIAENTHGSYINLSKSKLPTALYNLKNESYTFLGVKSISRGIQVYPKAGLIVENDFSLSGRYFKYGETITLLFGYGGKVSQRIRVKLQRSKTNKKEVARYWAQKKLDFLQNDAEKHKEEIIATGLKYKLVSDYTSLIVLDNVEDYIRYNITPPDQLLATFQKAQHKRIKSPRFRTPPMAPIDRTLNATNQIKERIIRVVNDNQNTEVVEMDEEEEEVIEYIEDVPFISIEETPVFPGCDGSLRELKACFSKKFNQHIEKNFNKEILTNQETTNRTIRAYVNFTINREGNIEDLNIRALLPEIKEEVLRVLQLLPKMKPGRQRGRPIDVKCYFPVFYEILNNKKGRTLKRFYVQFQRNNQNNINKPSYKKYSGALVLKERTITAPYVLELDAADNQDEAYAIYLKQRANYTNIPSYFVDVYNYFKKRFKEQLLADRIVSNIAETDVDNYEKLKVFAYQLEKQNKDAMALYIYKQILKLRTEDAQSYRDLAIASVNIGKQKEALALYRQIISKELYQGTKRRVFAGIESICKNEAKRLLQKNRKLRLEILSNKDEAPINYDLRVVVDWNHNDTDIDLHIIDPNLEECYYSHNTTSIGGHMSKDMTQGFGPEEFTLKNAIKGSYYIKINYYGDRYQKIENPTFMKITIFKYYGTKKETKTIQIIRLTKKDSKEIVAKVTF